MATSENDHPDVPILDLSQQHEQLQPELNDVIDDVIDRNAFILGDELDSFEDHFAEFCDTGHCVGLSSGTDALRMAVRAAGIGEGDEVITVPHTFIATVEAIVDVGARPVFVDIDPDTYCMDPENIPAALSDDTAAFLPVHLYGHPAPMDDLMDIAADHDLSVIEDASQAHGARWNGKRAGSFGISGCFSFYPGKNMGALGDAGCVTTSDPDQAERIRALRNHGQYGDKYDHAEPGFNARMDNLHAAVLELKLRRIDDWNASRREHAERYDQELGELDDITTPTVAESAEHVYHQYAILIDDRDEVRTHLADRNIQAGIHYPKPLHLQDAFADLGYERGDFPVSESVCTRVLTLPCFPEMTDEQQDHVINTLAGYIN